MSDLPVPPSYGAPPLPVDSVPSELSDLPSPDWEKKWQEASEAITSSDSAISIEVCEPELQGTSVVTKFVAYTVKTEPFMHSVSRRYTDFLWLREQLVVTYPGLLLPQLPPKKTTTGVHRDVDGEFVRARMHALDIFMKMLTKIPFLIGDKAMEAFCAKAAGPEWDACKKTFDEGPGSATTTGQLHWGRILDECEAPEDDLTIDRIVMEVRGNLKTLIANMDDLDKNWTATSNQVEKVQKAMEQMQLSVMEWQNFETEVADPGSQIVINALGEVMSRATAASTESMDQWNMESNGLTNAICKQLLGVIQTQDMLAKGMKDLLDSRDLVVKEIEKVEKELASLRLDHARLTQKRDSIFDQMTGKTPAKVEASISKRELRLEQLKVSNARVGRALWFSEVDRFGRERALQQEAIMKVVVEENVHRAKQSMDKWKAIAASLGVQ